MMQQQAQDAAYQKWSRIKKWCQARKQTLLLCVVLGVFMLFLADCVRQLSLQLKGTNESLSLQLNGMNASLQNTQTTLHSTVIELQQLRSTMINLQTEQNEDYNQVETVKLNLQKLLHATHSMSQQTKWAQPMEQHSSTTVTDPPRLSMTVGTPDGSPPELCKILQQTPTFAACPGLNFCPAPDVKAMRAQMAQFFRVPDDMVCLDAMFIF